MARIREYFLLFAKRCKNSLITNSLLDDLLPMLFLKARVSIQTIQKLLSAINLFHLTTVFFFSPLPYKANRAKQYWREMFLWTDQL